MSSFNSTQVLAHVSNASVEVAPSTRVGLFIFPFPEAGPQDPQYVRAGNRAAQQGAVADGAEWVLYTHSVMSYRIWMSDGFLPVGGASLIVEIGDDSVAGVPVMGDWAVFHLVPGLRMVNWASGIELPGLFARFSIRTASHVDEVSVNGSIILRGL